MNIGIDIDNTLTDIEKELFKVANIYTKEINPNFIPHKFIEYDGIRNMSDFYSFIFGWSSKETEYFFRNPRIEVVDNAKPRKYSREVIKKLKDEGNNIYIITARTKRFDDIPYERSKNWLDKNDIIYDKLIVEAVDKVSASKELNVKLFIDDQLNNCINLSKNGIHTIRLTDSNKKYENIVNIKSWDEIYKYIKGLNIVHGETSYE